MLEYFQMNGNGHFTVYTEELQKGSSVLSVSDDSGVMGSKDFQDFMAIMSFLGQKGEKQLGIIFNCFVDLATQKSQIDSTKNNV
jgi:prolyl-tRNA synthetase